MKKILLAFVCLTFSLTSYAQSNVSIETDIFGDIIGSTNGVRSKLEKNIFDDLIFSDNNQNKITYKKDFLDKVLRLSPNDKRFQKDLFITLSRFLRDKKNYQETHAVDIFDKVIISSNQGDKTSMDLDMVSDQDRFFWTNKYNIANNQVDHPNRHHIIRDAFNNLSYRNRNVWAKLTITERGEAEYQDSYNNRIRYNRQAWKRNLEAHNGDYNYFEYLIDLYIGE